MLNNHTRREFVSATAAASAAALLPNWKAWSAPQAKKIRLAVLGGGFGATFHFHEHPNCVVTAATDLYEGRRQRLRDYYKLDAVYNSFDEMLKARNTFDAVAVFSGAQDHAKHVLQCFHHGLHVLSAVPACMTLEEAQQLKEAKEKTGLRYMMAESSYYRTGCIYARDLYKKGGFGEIHYSELEYYHDFPATRFQNNPRSLWYNPDGSESWRKGLPPMLYPTHSLGFLVGVTKERIVKLNCLGWGPDHPNYRYQENRYQNPFANQFALMETNQGHMTRCNVFWEVAADGEQARWFGEKGTLYMALPRIHSDIWHERFGQPKPIEFPKYWMSEALPPSMRHESGHGGSAIFISAEFINALVEDREPEIDIYESLAMTVPGIVAHQSSLKGGETMKVPSFDRKQA